MEFVILVIVSWLVMIVAWIASLGHLSDRTTRGQMLTNGWRMFVRANFTPRGLFWRRVFLVGVAGVIVGIAGVSMFRWHP